MTTEGILNFSSGINEVYFLLLLENESKVTHLLFLLSTTKYTRGIYDCFQLVLVLQATSINITSVCVFRTLREQWIRAKYERKEFSEPGKNFIYEEGECLCTTQHTHTYMRAHTKVHSC